MAAWPAAVGEAIARNAWPARIGRDGVLHVSTADSIWAFELGHRASEIASRLGVSGVRFAAGPLPDAAAEERPPARISPSDEERRTAASTVAAIADENLRETVQKAVGFWLATRAANPTV